MKNHRLFIYSLSLSVILFLIIASKLIFLRRNLQLWDRKMVEFEFLMMEITNNCRYQAKGSFDFLLPGCERLVLGEKYTILGRVKGVIDNKVQYAKNLDVIEIFPSVEKSRSSNFHLTAYTLKIGELMRGVREKLVRLVQLNFAPENAQIALALSLGNKAVELDESLKETVRSVGLSHMMAVSGFHLGVVSLVLGFILTVFLRRKPAKVILILTLLAYVGLVGSPLSMLRACFMLLFSLIGRDFLSKPVNQVFNLIVCFLFMSLQSVLSVYDVGFQLSFLATAGIIILNRDFSSLEELFLSGKTLAVEKRGWTWQKLKSWGNSIKGLILTSIAAQLATLPVLVSVFGEYSTWSILSTLVFSTLITLIVTWMTGIMLLLLFCSHGVIFNWLVLPYIWVLDWFLSGFVTLFAKYAQNFGGIMTLSISLEWWSFGLYFGMLLLFSYFIRKMQRKHYVYIKR